MASVATSFIEGLVFEATTSRSPAPGERAALEGILSQLNAEVAIVVEGDDSVLSRVAARASQVWAISRDGTSATATDLRNVNRVIGEPHSCMSSVLADLATDAKNVDFVFLGGNPSAGRIRGGITAVLESPAVANSVLVVANASHERVRTGLDSVPLAAVPKVAYVDFDFVPGRIRRERTAPGELVSGGLAMVMVDAARLTRGSPPLDPGLFYPTAHMLYEARDLLMARDAPSPVLAVRARQRLLARYPTLIDELKDDLRAEDQATIRKLELRVSELESVARHHEALWRSITQSLSWRITAPLRLMLRIVRFLSR